LTKQELKLKEAEYFYNEMISKFENELYEPFNYNLSAFLTATRSILQYTYDDANKLGKLKDYNNLVSNNKILKFFKEKRDINIHTVPVKTIQQVNLDLYCTITIRESVKITVMDSDGNVQEERNFGGSDDSNSRSSSQSSPLVRSLQYRFVDWPGEEDVIELSTKYLNELRKFIIKAKALKIIQ
jgi:hypothetical protein